jgi:arylsulfatase A-like enzyme
VRVALRRLACLAALCGVRCAVPEGPEELVVLVVVDTLRHDALGCYGGPRDASPRIDALAQEGVLFEQAIATSGWTLPSVASLLTGAWPVVHKARGQKTLLTPISPDVPTAAELLADAGFHTAAVVNAAFLSPLLGIGRGFERFDHRHAFNREIRRADETVRDALALLDERRAARRFLFVHLFDPHLDYDPPDGGEGLSRRDCLELGAAGIDAIRARYQGEVRAVDGAVGLLVDGLAERGLWDHTTLVLCADHGEEFFEHGGFEHGHTLFDELIRVPLIVRPRPSTPVAPRPVSHPVSLVDVMPTLFEWEGVEAPDTFLGRSLADLIAGAAPDSATPRPVFSQGRLYGSDLLSWRTDRYHYLFDRGSQAGGANHLFDWRADPLEQRDLAEERPDLVSELHGQLARFFGQMQHRSRLLAVPDTQDMSPSRVREWAAGLESLGYTDGNEGR